MEHRKVGFRRDLWHAVLFYTSGELVAGLVPGYTSYADKNGLWHPALMQMGGRALSETGNLICSQPLEPHAR